MFRDSSYIVQTRALISEERSRIYELFSKDNRFKAYPPSGNFMLVRLLDDTLTSGLLFERAIRRQMMIRDCSTFPFLNNKYIRFCFMSPEMNDKLLNCLLA